MNRSTLLKEVDTDTANLLKQVADMDDLVMQFDGTDAGKQFSKHGNAPASSWIPAADTAAHRPRRPRLRIRKIKLENAKRPSETKAAFYALKALRKLA